MLIHSVEEARYGGPASKFSDPFTIVVCVLSLTGFKLVAEVTVHINALLEYRVHNLSLTSDSRQNLQLDPHSIPSVNVAPRLSYQFCLPVHYSIM